MKPVAFALSLLLLAGCSSAKPGEDANLTAHLVPAPTDTATVRRLCSTPDSVLAKRAPCVLREDVVGVKKF